MASRDDHRERDGALRLTLVLLTFVVLIAGIPFHRAISPIPSHEPLFGLDLQLVYAFHHCEARDQPYGIDGAVCGDILGRPLHYPPLLYFSFVWTRLFAFDTAVLIWTFAIVFAIFVTSLVWSLDLTPDAGSRLAVTTFSFLLLFQVPVLFAVIRGNSDNVVLILWTVAYLAYRSGRPGAAGFLAGVAAVTKIYPVWAMLVVMAGLFAGARSSLKRFVGGCAAGGLLPMVLFPSNTAAFLRVMPELLAIRDDVDVFGHALPNTFESDPWLAPATSLVLFTLWCIASWVAFQRGSAVTAFAGGLAISTYFANVSYDYNLITVYPLLLLLAVSAWQRPVSAVRFGLLLALLLTVVGPRGIFTSAPRLRVILQVAALAQVAVVTFVGRGAAAAPLPREAPIEPDSGPNPGGVSCG